MTTPIISVVICTFNRERFLPGLFESILAQTMPRDKFEIVLINNNSTDSTERLCKEFMEANPTYSIHYFVEEKLGVSYARNRGFKESRAPYIIFADDDAVIAEDFAQAAYDYFESHPDVGVLGGPIKLKFMCKVPDWYNPWMANLLGYFVPSNKEYVLRMKNSRYPRGSNMSFRRSVIDRYGDFLTDLGRVGRTLLGGEEKEICFRMMDHGVTVAYSPTIVAYHIVFEDRTTFDFIHKQALGTGWSERIRTKNDGRYLQRIVIEMIKWGATLVLWPYYMIIGRPAAANMLVRFRAWVTQGLIFLKQHPK